MQKVIPYDLPFSHNTSMVPARYPKGPLFRKSFVQIRATVLTFGLRLGLGLVL